MEVIQGAQKPGFSLFCVTVFFGLLAHICFRCASLLGSVLSVTS